MNDYVPIFAPRAVAPPSATPPAPHLDVGDSAPSGLYVFTDEITLALNVALATGRPLLVRGTSGSGKTSLARSVAAQMGWVYREAVITARTQARDLLWTVDLLRRLQDAQLGRLSEDWRTYVVPGELWWAFDARSARAQQQRPTATPPDQPASGERSVLLIDEIDKADPDVPNSLLRPIGDLAFEVEETGQRVVGTAPPPLILITSNEERDLPPAFLRRCVELNMPAFDRRRLEAVGRAHFPSAGETLIGGVADLVLSAGLLRDRREPNAAEYLDVLRACTQLNITPSSDAFRMLSSIALGTPAAV
jgi:MoxR-like ATPase